ncbi:hypothetical protein EVG20_g10535 [Dentipellis fragilis]|uniref:Uncharacterized protein n=1 Tax=Dentipellis fragilis TaxID=205917 RepID=A0A4Y9XSU6_9AGAM|nr:hypothetical protein EVG20_g10535 [Dentipellis fragilis]
MTVLSPTLIHSSTAPTALVTGPRNPAFCPHSYSSPSSSGNLPHSDANSIVLLGNSRLCRPARRLGPARPSGGSWSVARSLPRARPRHELPANAISSCMPACLPLVRFPNRLPTLVRRGSLDAQPSPSSSFHNFNLSFHLGSLPLDVLPLSPPGPRIT